MSKKKRIKELERELVVMRRAIVDLVQEVWDLRAQAIAASGADPEILKSMDLS